MVTEQVANAIQEAYAFAGTATSLEEVRTGLDASMTRAPGPGGVTAEPGTCGEVNGVWQIPDAPSRKQVLFLHGGGFQFGSSTSHGVLAAELAAQSGARVFVADYRLAPEHPFPAGLEDALACLKAMIAGADEPGDVVVAGDSAGGGLALATLLAAKTERLPMPGALVTMSAWTDLTMTGESITSKADDDPYVDTAQLDANTAAYLGNHDPRDPLASPLFGELSGLPPVYMQVGSEEILWDDTMRVAQKVKEAGGTVTVDVLDGMPHAHQVFAWLLPDGGAATTRAAQFIGSL